MCHLVQGKGRLPVPQGVLCKKCGWLSNIEGHTFLSYTFVSFTYFKYSHCKGETKMCTRSYDIKRELVSSRETLRYFLKVYLTTHRNYFFVFTGGIHVC